MSAVFILKTQTLSLQKTKQNKGSSVAVKRPEVDFRNIKVIHLDCSGLLFQTATDLFG